MFILNRIDKELKEESETKETQDEEHFYGQTVAVSIRKLGDMEKCMIKHEINNILFKCQISIAKNCLPNTTNPYQVFCCNFQQFQLATYPCTKFLKSLLHIATDPLCNQLTHLTNIKRKKHISYAYTK